VEGRQCIYCRTHDGDFGPEEHVIPESLGGDAIILVDGDAVEREALGGRFTFNCSGACDWDTAGLREFWI